MLLASMQQHRSVCILRELCCGKSVETHSASWRFSTVHQLISDKQIKIQVCSKAFRLQGLAGWHLPYELEHKAKRHIS